MDYSKEFTVEKMCNVLEVSTSGYYKWRKLHKHKVASKNDLQDHIKYEFERSQGTYGSPRIADELNAKQYMCSKSTVARYMKQMNIAARCKKPFKVTTDSNHDFGFFRNLLNREFDVAQPGTVWVSNITYIRVAGYWLYLTVVIDLADRMVLGWSLSKDLSTSSTVIPVFINAYKFRQPTKGFMFHSDRGIQYACQEFTQLVKNHHGIQSMSRKGNCWDNAVAESFFKTLKIESIYKYDIMTKKQAYSIIFNYIDGWYNTQRRHSALNGLAPIDAFLLKSKMLKLAA